MVLSGSPVYSPTVGSHPTASTPTSTLDIVISLAVLVFILYRQWQVRPARGTFLLPIILLVLGFAGFAAGTGNGRLTSEHVAILVALLAGDAIGLGVLRAWTVRLWRQDATFLRQGTWLTIGLWLVGVAIHEVVDILVDLPAGSLLIYFGVTLAAQQLVIQARVSRLERQPVGATGATGATRPSLADGQDPRSNRQYPVDGKRRE
jgi:hypothetical protein